VFTSEEKAFSWKLQRVPYLGFSLSLSSFTYKQTQANKTRATPCYV